MNPITVLQTEDILRKLQEPPHALRANYFAMYSSWYGGITKNPQLMVIPIDDHIVHRGDGVFEAAKAIEHRIYGLDAHLERLAKSAEAIGLTLPHTLSEMKEIVVETVRASEARDCVIRLYVSRGPGGFTANPYECIKSQLYVVITQIKPAPNEAYEKGVSVKVSSFKVKDGIFATVKSCNYLINVLMKKESIDNKVDFTVTRDENGFLAEGSTENFAIISKDGEFLVPGFERTLKGITASRMMELAVPLMKEGLIRGVRNAHITEKDVSEAREAMMLGTTLDVLPVTKFESAPVGNGSVGPVCRRFLEVLKEDMVSGPFVTQV